MLKRNKKHPDTLFYAIHEPAIKHAPEAPAYLIMALEQSVKAFINRKVAIAIDSHDEYTCRVLNDLFIDLTKSHSD